MFTKNTAGETNAHDLENWGTDPSNTLVCGHTDKEQGQLLCQTN